MRNAIRCAALLLLAAAQPAAAQVVRGRVMESRTGYPVAFANVTVLDETGEPAGYAQSGAAGEFSVRLRRGGRFYVRAERIGYRSAQSGLSDVAEGDEAYRLLTMRRGSEALGEAGSGIPGVWPRGPFLARGGRMATDTRPAATRAPAGTSGDPPAGGGVARRPTPATAAPAEPRGVAEKPRGTARAARPSTRAGGAIRRPASVRPGPRR